MKHFTTLGIVRYNNTGGEFSIVSAEKKNIADMDEVVCATRKCMRTATL